MKKLILSLILGTFIFVGCKPLIQTQYVDRWHETIKTDSVFKYQKDTVTLQQKGDTIFINHYSTKIDYKFKYLQKTDTVAKEITKFVPVEKKITVEKTRWISWIDWIIIVIAFLYGVFRLLKFLKFV